VAINVELGDVVSAQRLAMRGIREGGSPEADADARLMIVYTGWLSVNLATGSNLHRETFVSFVPNGLGQIQTFKPDNEGDLGVVQAVVTASLSSFGDSPVTAAVDRASVSIEPRQFPGEGGSPRVLILRARLAVSEGTIHAISYQVTVLANPLLLDKTLTLGDGATP
jgi:hypothetical protein